MYMCVWAKKNLIIIAYTLFIIIPIIPPKKYAEQNLQHRINEW